MVNNEINEILEKNRILNDDYNLVEVNNKEEFLKKCKKTLKRKKVKIKNRREGAMNNQEDINLCDFPGIYIMSFL